MKDGRSILEQRSSTEGKCWRDRSRDLLWGGSCSFLHTNLSEVALRCEASRVQLATLNDEPAPSSGQNVSVTKELPYSNGLARGLSQKRSSPSISVSGSRAGQSGMRVGSGRQSTPPMDVSTRLFKPSSQSAGLPDGASRFSSGISDSETKPELCQAVEW